MRSHVLALAAASTVVSGVAFSLHAAFSPSSQSSTVADEATTAGKGDSVAVAEPELPQEAMPAAVLAPSVEASQTDFLRPSIEAFQMEFLRPSIEASRTDSLAPSTQASPTDIYDVAEEASDDRTAVEVSLGTPPVVVAERVEQPDFEQPVDQASLDQPAPAPKGFKQKNPKTTAKKPVSRDRANKKQHQAKAVAAPEAKDRALASYQEPATGYVQDAPSTVTFPNPISKLRELFSAP